MMRNNFFRYSVGGLILLGLAFYAFTWQLREGSSAIRLRLGKAVDVVDAPGLHVKMPWPIDQIVVLDARKRVLKTRHTEMLTRDKKNVILLSYVVWRISDPLLFYQSVGSIEAGDSKLDGLVTNAKISVLGGYDLSALVSTNGEDLMTEEIEAAILNDVSKNASEKYGVQIEEVGFERLSLPESNTRFVFDQMRAERKQYAARSNTMLEVAKIRAEATEQAARIRGEAEAEAARIYAEAHRVDPAFYRFTRSLESLEKVLNRRTQIVLRTDTPPFELLEEQ